ncbi:recombinase family protein [Kitasatospora sp. NPDC085895]|uniref:recombinase family protein n=1 Tax=Kitasatospora sp. NPDC085895 TaxID=3155057 RepID=UPI00344D17ED
MAELVRKWVSTDRQSTARQNFVLDEAGIEGPVAFEEPPGTSSRLHPLQRPKFGELLAPVRPGDTVHISEMFRLVRGTGRILDVLDVLHQGRLALRITAAPAIHRRPLTHCQPLDGGQGVPAVPAQRRARREYESRVSALTPIEP